MKRLRCADCGKAHSRMHESRTGHEAVSPYKALVLQVVAEHPQGLVAIVVLRAFDRAQAERWLAARRAP
jgi:hypothetical protein